MEHLLAKDNWFNFFLTYKPGVLLTENRKSQKWKWMSPHNEGEMWGGSLFVGRQSNSTWWLTVVCLYVGELIYLWCSCHYLLLVHKVSQDWSLCGGVWGLPWHNDIVSVSVMDRDVHGGTRCIGNWGRTICTRRQHSGIVVIMLYSRKGVKLSEAGRKCLHPGGPTCDRDKGAVLCGASFSDHA